MKEGIAIRQDMQSRDASAPKIALVTNRLENSNELQSCFPGPLPPLCLPNNPPRGPRVG